MNSRFSKNILLLFFTLGIVVSILLFVRTKGYLTVKSSDVCLTCHDDNSLTTEINGKKISLCVKRESLKNSVHSFAECEDCHTKYNPDEIPHTKTKTIVNCKSCHDDLKGMENSVHDEVKCSDCHSKHDIKPAKEFSKEQTSNCLRCHINKNILLYKTSVHFQRNIGCEGCHQGGHSTKKIAKQDVAVTCGKCHGSNQHSFNNSIHQTVLSSGNKNAPTCTDCHGSHEILTGKMSIESQSCLKCHLNEKLFPGKDKGSAKFVSEYKTSIHASIQKNGKEAAGCVDCHGNHQIQDPSNPSASLTKLRLPETCGTCHKDEFEKYKHSAHGKALVDRLVAAPSCVDCHSEHSIKSVRSSDEFSKINQVDLCLRCHQEGKLPHKNYKGEEVLISSYKDSYHYKALKEGKLNAATCSDCHGSHEMNKFDNPISRVNKKNIEKTCGQSGCHVKQLGEYTGSIHEVSIKTKDNSEAPTCTNCHGNHQIEKKDEITNRISNSKGLVQLCSSCHNSVELVNKYKLPMGRTDSYMNSFHGLAVRGGSKVAANCESCHGNHNIRPSTDTLSTINKKNLPQTCGKCHPGAQETLFSTRIHVVNQYVESPALFWVTKFYLVMIIGLIGGMVFHNAIDFSKKLKKKNEKDQKDDDEK